MITRLKLKILAFGSQIMLHRLTARVDKDEVSLTDCSEASAAENILGKEQFDMVIVDNLVKDAEAICQDVFDAAKVPVALMLRESGADWRKLRKLNVDGYLPDEAGSAELMARIKAFSRRKPIRQQS
jgi:DNA-binding response OmpR family regulator